MKKIFFDFLLKLGVFLVILLLTSCALVYNPATGRKEMVVFDTEQEVRLGKSFDAQIRKDYNISQDQVLRLRVDRIGQQVANTSDRIDIKYNFEIIEEEGLNAFAIPGGFIYVHTETMEEATDDELACILAHEIGHIAARHPIKRFEAQYGYHLPIAIILGQVSSTETRYILDTFLNNIVPLGYSREDENWADKLGVKYAYLAGFDPNAMVSFFNKLLEAKKDRADVPVFMRSHPYVEERIGKVETEIKSLKNGDLPDKE